MEIHVETGRVSKHVKIAELILRAIVTEEDDDEEEQIETRLQGRLENISGKFLDDIRYDVSYYDKDDKFLGLDRSGFLDDDEMEGGDQLPIDLEVDLPEDCVRCVFNVRAKRAGWIGRLL